MATWSTYDRMPYLVEDAMQWSICSGLIVTEEVEEKPRGGGGGAPVILPSPPRDVSFSELPRTSLCPLGA